MADAPKPDAKVTKYEPPKELEQKAAVQKFQGRPKRQPVEQAEYFYSVKGTHIAFFVASLGMLISFLMMFHKDYARPWKPYQTEFAQMDFEKLWFDMNKLEVEVKAREREINDLDAKIDQFMGKFPDSEKAEGTPLESNLFEPDLPVPPGAEKTVHLWVLKEKQKLYAKEQENIRGKLYATNQAQNFAKDELGAVRFAYEDAKHHLEEAQKSAPDRVEHFEREFEHEKKQWDRVQKMVSDSKAAFDEVQKQSSFYEDFAAEVEKRASVKGIWNGPKSFNAMKDERVAKVKELEDKKLRFSKEKPSFANTVRNAPGADFFAPTLKVRNHILLGLKDQLNFAQVTKVDRCDTCHVGIDKPTYEVRFKPDAVNDEDKVVFKDPFLRAFVDHARGKVEVGQCIVCQGHTEKSEIKQPLTAHGAWTTAGEAVKFTKVFMAHPRLDLFVGDASKHKLDAVGCTICHEGDGRDTDFTRVVHTPNTAKQGQEWRVRHGTPYGEEKYNWNYRELWDLPMFPTKYVQASCRRCHVDAVELDGGEKYVEGMKLVERVGCYGCHRIDSYQILQKDLNNPAIDINRKSRRPGPPLDRIATKVTEEWAAKWIIAPRDFRPTTRMPHFFGLSNTRRSVNGHDYKPETKGGVLRSPIDDTIVNSIVKYLWSLSETKNEDVMPGNLKGDVVKGEILVKSLGCVACHKTEETPLSVFLAKGPAARSRFLEEFAPNLAGVGSKMNKVWLYQWVRDPKKHFNTTRMPNLRLSEQDATDVVEYLLSLKKPDWEKLGAPESNPAVVDDLLRELLSKSMSIYDVDQTIAGKSQSKLYKELASADGKVRWLGRKMLKNYGCYSCHKVKADSDPDVGMDWQAEEGIGVELSGSQPWGSKHHDKLDYGFTEDDGVNHHGVHFQHGLTGEEIEVHVDETRQDWLENKLKNPRVFDGGKMASKPWDELLRMPLFAFNEREIESISTFILSFTDHDVAGLVENAKKRPSPDEMAKYRGDRLVRENNCRACHRFSMDTFKLEWKHIDEVKKKEVTEWPVVEGRFGNEMAADDTERTLRKWVNPADKKPLLAAGEDLKKSGKKLYTYSWTSDHSKLTMSGAVSPDSKFVYFDGDDRWYLDVQGGEIKAMRPVLQYHPQEGGEILADLRKFKKDLSEANKPYDDKKYEKYTDFMDISNESEFETRFPPMLRSQGVKTQTEWFYRFLKAPYPIRPTLQPIYPGAKTLPDSNLRMPTFDFSDEAANSIVRWFAVRDHESGKDFYPNTEFPEREISFLENRKAALDKVGPVIRDTNTGCASCHYMAGQAPPGVVLKHAPDLARVEDRLRPRWLYEWVDVPANIYPGTTMTSYDFKPIFGGNQREGVHAAVEYMLNFGKFSAKSSAPK